MPMSTYPKKKYWIEAGDIKTKLPKQHNTGMFRSLDEIVWDILKCCGWDCCTKSPGDVAELTFENGLTRTGNTIKLGGALTEPVVITGDAGEETFKIDLVKGSENTIYHQQPSIVTTTSLNALASTIIEHRPSQLTVNFTGAGTGFGVGTTLPTSKLHVVGLPEYADNAAAVTGLLTVGAFYHTAGVLKVVI